MRSAMRFFNQHLSTISQTMKTQVVLGLYACSHWVAAAAMPGLAADARLKVPMSEMSEISEVQISSVEISGAQAGNVDAEGADSEAPELGSATQPTGLPDSGLQADAGPEASADAAPADDAAASIEGIAQAEPPPGAPGEADEEAQFTGLQPSEMFRWMREEPAREDGPGQAATADQEDLAREAERLRTAEFVSAIVAAMESAM